MTNNQAGGHSGIDQFLNQSAAIEELNDLRNDLDNFLCSLDRLVTTYRGELKRELETNDRSRAQYLNGLSSAVAYVRDLYQDRVINAPERRAAQDDEPIALWFPEYVGHDEPDDFGQRDDIGGDE